MELCPFCFSITSLKHCVIICSFNCIVLTLLSFNLFYEFSWASYIQILVCQQKTLIKISRSLIKRLQNLLISIIFTAFIITPLFVHTLFLFFVYFPLHYSRPTLVFCWHGFVFNVLNKDRFLKKLTRHLMNISPHICFSFLLIWTAISPEMNSRCRCGAVGHRLPGPVRRWTPEKERDVTFGCWSHSQPVKYLSWMAELLDSECRNPVETDISGQGKAEDKKKNCQWAKQRLFIFYLKLQKLSWSSALTLRKKLDFSWLCCKSFLILGEYVRPGTETQHGNLKTPLLGAQVFA